MFTGIIETTGIITEHFSSGTNRTFWVSSPLSQEFKVDQSVSHNGVCLTVEEVINGHHRITAIEETLLKTNLHSWKKDSIVNIERCMQMNGRLDGHIVQGHVDTTVECIGSADKKGSWEFTFMIDESFASFIIEKGSITINGISLTLFNTGKQTFTVAIIPYTYQHTNIQYLRKGDRVNIEFDMIGKYINRITNYRQQNSN